MKVGDQVKLKEDLYFYLYGVKYTGKDLKGEMIKVGRKGDTDIVKGVAFNPFLNQNMIALESTPIDFVWDDQLEVIKSS